MPKAKTTAILLDEAKQKFVKRVEELWDEHKKGIEKIIADSEGKKINVSFTAKLDFSEAVATVQSVVGYSEHHSDIRSDDIENGQGVLEGMESPDTKPTPKRRKKRDDEDTEEPAED